MAWKKISQKDARRFKARVDQLERERRTSLERWSREYPGGINIAHTPPIGPVNVGKVETAMKLGFVIVAKLDGETLSLHAVKP